MPSKPTQKEVQLTSHAIGQAGEYRSRPLRRATSSIGAPSRASAWYGAAFRAVLPAQNATGNWIKVVQRVPVRIALDPQQVAAQSVTHRSVRHTGVDPCATIRVATRAGARKEPVLNTDILRHRHDEIGARIAQHRRG